MEKLKAYIKAQNMTQADFAGALGISAPYLSQILKGERLPGWELMQKIEKTTDQAVSLDAWRNPSSEDAA